MSERTIVVINGKQKHGGMNSNQKHPEKTFLLKVANLGIMDNYYITTTFIGNVSCGADVSHQNQYYNVTYFDMPVRSFIDKNADLENSTDASCWKQEINDLPNERYRPGDYVCRVVPSIKTLETAMIRVCFQHHCVQWPMIFFLRSGGGHETIPDRRHAFNEFHRIR